MKELVEKIIDYTKKWSISETEWYWNVECTRKPQNINNKEISWEEFEVAIREEILYDLVYKNGICTRNQMENDICCGYDSELFYVESEELEEEIKKLISDFSVERYYKGREE